GQAALASAALPENLIAWASDPEVAEAYPIVTYTWLITYKKYPDKNKQQAIQDLIKYGLTDGQKDAEALGYIPLPQTAVDKASAPVQTVPSASRVGPNRSPGPPLLLDGMFETRPGDVARVPSRGQLLADRVFRGACLTFACLTVLLVTFIVLRIAVSAAPAMQRYGIGFLSGRVWDPNTERYGILAEMWGTLDTSILALVIGTAFGVAVARVL